MGNTQPDLRLASYLDLLSRVARPLGLIGFDDEKAKEQVERCTVLAQLINSPERVFDVGSGAGLPGIPVALTLQKMYPNARSAPPFEVILIEPKRKAIGFLEKVVRELGLNNVTIYAGRAEQAAAENLAGTADWVLAKAVAPPNKSLRLCLPLCRPGGAVIVTAPRQRPAVMTAPGLDIQFRVLRDGSGTEQAVMIARRTQT